MSDYKKLLVWQKAIELAIETIVAVVPVWPTPVGFQNEIIGI